MRGFCILILLTIATRLLSQDFELVTTGDTVTIRATNITNDPFRFGNNPLGYLQKFKPKSTYETYENNHVEGKIDTTFTLTIGKDNFKVTKWDNEENGLLNAYVTTNKFKTRLGVQIGMRKNEVVEKFSKYGLKTVHGDLVLENMEVYELLVFRFTEDKLTKIEFHGYYD